MYLIDTNVVSEARKGQRANPGVRDFFKMGEASGAPLYISVISVGELRRGVELIRHRRDFDQAAILENWLVALLEQFDDHILDFDTNAAQVWGRLRVPNAEHELDKQIGAIALVNDLTVATRNTADFTGTGVRLHNPFSATAPGGVG